MYIEASRDMHAARQGRRQVCPTRLALFRMLTSFSSSEIENAGLSRYIADQKNEIDLVQAIEF